MIIWIFNDQHTILTNKKKTVGYWHIDFNSRGVLNLSAWNVRNTAYRWRCDLWERWDSHKIYIKSIRFHLIIAINLFLDPSNTQNKSILQRGINNLIGRSLSVKNVSSAKAQSIQLDERSVVSFTLTRNCVDGKKRHRMSKFVDFVLKCPDMFSLHCSCSPGKPRSHFCPFYESPFPRKLTIRWHKKGRKISCSFFSII